LSIEARKKWMGEKEKAFEGKERCLFSTKD
jgi:hypothetical protein